MRKSPIGRSAFPGGGRNDFGNGSQRDGRTRGVAGSGEERRTTSRDVPFGGGGGESPGGDGGGGCGLREKGDARSGAARSRERVPGVFADSRFGATRKRHGGCMRGFWSAARGAEFGPGSGGLSEVVSELAPQSGRQAARDAIELDDFAPQQFSPEH